MRQTNARKVKVTKPQSNTASKKETRKKSTAVKVALDRLAWKPVELPDRLEDPEGFYGLEEIDDVEVTRDEAGNIEYLVHSNGLVKEGSDDLEDSEWEGFEDEPAPDQLHAPQPKAQKGKAKAEGLSSIHDIEGNVFDLLQEESAEHEADVSAWSILNLRPDTMSAIAKLGFAKPTSIQAAAIPEINAGRDVIGKAPTGSGKTLAFGIPILEHILSSGDEANPGEVNFTPSAFIISPTRELARQLEDHLTALCSSVTSKARVATVTGGLAVQKQQRLLPKAAIVIGTPGRLWDVLNSTPGFFDKLRKIKFLVIDEADRLLSGGHFKEVEEILRSLDRHDENGRTADATSNAGPRQTLIFSATFHRDLQQKLAGKKHTVDQPNSMSYLIEKLRFRDPNGKPKFLDINPGGESQLAPLLKEAMLECSTADKDLYLYATLLLQPAKTKTLVFANSINTVRQLTLMLQALHLPAHALHSQMPQKSRLKALERFAAGKLPAPAAMPDANPVQNAGYATSTTGPILIATDIAARGLDIPAVHLVLHYHTPRTADSYIHRSGRTARASAAGTTLVLCSPEEVVQVRRLVTKVHAQQSGGRSTAGLRSARLDRTLAHRLRPHIALAAQIAKLETDGARARSKDSLLREAAEDLGVDLDDDLGSDAERSGGGGKHRKQSGRKDGTRALRNELRDLLRRRVNIGVSERYLTAGGVDIDALLRGEAGMFLGITGGLEID